MKLPQANEPWGRHYDYIKSTVDDAMREVEQALKNCPWDTDKERPVIMYRENDEPRIGLTLTYAGDAVGHFSSSFSEFLDETEGLYRCFDQHADLLADLVALRDALTTRIKAIRKWEAAL